MPQVYLHPLKNSDIPIGSRFAQWTVIGPFINVKDGRNKSQVYYPCACDCGWEAMVSVRSILSGKSKSCGCTASRSTIGETMRTHGMSDTDIYKRWAGMITRCTNPKQCNWKNYGGKGVTVCREWRDFAKFYEWAMKHGYQPYLELDRINNNGNYEPLNCRFVTGGRNARNKSTSVFVTAYSETKCLEDWFVDPRCVVCPSSYRRRIRKGWLPEKALTTPRISGNRFTGTVKPLI